MPKSTIYKSLKKAARSFGCWSALAETQTVFIKPCDLSHISSEDRGRSIRDLFRLLKHKPLMGVTDSGTMFVAADRFPSIRTEWPTVVSISMVRMYEGNNALIGYLADKSLNKFEEYALHQVFHTITREVKIATAPGMSLSMMETENSYPDNLYPYYVCGHKFGEIPPPKEAKGVKILKCKEGGQFRWQDETGTVFRGQYSAKRKKVCWRE